MVIVEFIELSPDFLQENNIQLFFPTIEMTTDNALMIAIAGYLRSIKNKTLNIKDLSAEGNLRLS